MYVCMESVENKLDILGIMGGLWINCRKLHENCTIAFNLYPHYCIL